MADGLMQPVQGPGMPSHDIQVQLQAAQQRLLQLEAELLAAQQSQHPGRDSELQSSQQLVEQLQAELHAAQAAQQQQLGEAQGQLLSVQQRAEQLQGEVQGKDKLLQAAQQQLQEQVRKAEQLQAQLQGSQADQTHHDTQARLQEALNSAHQAQGRQLALEAQLDEARAQQEQLAAALAAAEAGSRAAQQAAEQAQGTLRTLGEEHQQLRDRHAVARTEFDKLKALAGERKKAALELQQQVCVSWLRNDNRGWHESCSRRCV